MPAHDDIAAITKKLNAERAKLLDSFRGLTQQALTQPFEGGWAIKDVLAHIAMAEGVNTKFAQLMLAKESPAQLNELANEYPEYPMPFTLDKFNAWMTERWKTKSVIEIIDALHATRAATLAWLERLTDAQLERKGKHAVWEDQTVRGMFRILVIHDKFHRGDIERRKAWSLAPGRENLSASDVQHLQEALKVARRARQCGNHPFGAILVDEAGNILIESENTVVTERDVTGHAETNLVRKASQKFTHETLERCTLYTSTEPCPMCAGAIYWSQIGRVVFGLSAKSLYSITGDELAARLPSCQDILQVRGVQVIGPVPEVESESVHVDFWNQDLT